MVCEIQAGSTEIDQQADSRAEGELAAIFRIVKARTGHDFSSYKTSTVLRRLERRLAVHEAASLGAYLAILEENAQEPHALAQDILIGVTSFFRDPEAFDRIRREIIPRLFADRDPREPVRIWHACCATGEEVYSMAILIREYLEREGLEIAVQFFATDIDEAAIAEARAGLYSDSAVAGLGAERLNAFFTRVNDRWQVTKPLREMIVFAHHSLIKDPPFSRLDLLVCRNFLIYLNVEMQQRLFALFHQVLRPTGFLFLGAAETVGRGSDLFAPVDKKWKIFRRLEVSRRAELPLPFTSPFLWLPGAGRPDRSAAAPESSPGIVAEKLLMERYAPPCVVVDERYRIVHVSARANRFLEVPAGEPTRDILRMAREELRPALRAAIHKSFAEGDVAVFRGVTCGEATVDVLVEPLGALPPAAKLAMIVFAPAAPAASAAPSGEDIPPVGDEAAREQLVHQLEEQLRMTHEQLHAVTEQLGTSHEGFLSANEELMSINEEFQSANEELQSTNEELETSKEELHALNEELVTVNAALQAKVAELDQAGSDMENLLVSSEVATLFLDRRLTIKRFTPAMAAIFNLIPADIGRSFRRLAGKLDWPTLARDAEAVMAGEPFMEREVMPLEEGRCYLKRVFPYRTAAGEIDGIAITFIDITERKRMEEALRRGAAQWERTFDSVPDLIAIMDDRHRIVRVNRAMAERLGTTADECVGRACYCSVHGADRPPDVCPHTLTLADGREHEAEIHEDRLGGDFLVSTTPLCDEHGRMVGSVHVARDITERKRIESDLRESYARLNLVADTASKLLRSDSPQQIVDELCRRVMEILDCQAFFNFLVDEQAGRLHLNACAGIPAKEAAKIEWLDLGVAVCGCAAQDACRIIAEDVQHTPDPRTELIRSYGIRAYACHPLMARGRVLGTLSFGTTGRDRFTADDVALMKVVADQVAIAMERKLTEEGLLRAHDELEQRVRGRTEELAMTVETLLGEIAERERAEAGLRRLNRLYAALSEIDQAIVRVADRETLFRDFCRIAVEHGGFLLAWVGLVDEGSGQVRMVAASGATGYLDEIGVTANREPVGEGPTGISIREGTYYISNDFQHDPCTRPWQEKGEGYGFRASAAIALREDGRVIGSLTLYAGEKDFFDQQHEALLRQMGTDISFALGNLMQEARRREAERALQAETLERLRAVETLREQERLLIQQSRQAALGEMIGNIAHQWRQPLNMLGLLIQQLPLAHETGELGREQLEATVGKAMQVIFHMSQTIDDFRNFFRADKEPVAFRVRQIVDKALSIIEGSLREHRIEVDVAAAGDPSVEGYPNEYAQVLLNVLLNARDALIERQVDKPRIRLQLSEENGRSVVAIADNGGGVPAEIMDKIFDPYFTTKGPDKGTGVGLYMSKVIIEKNMNGRLAARNGEDGAEFRIEV